MRITHSKKMKINNCRKEFVFIKVYNKKLTINAVKYNQKNKTKFHSRHKL